jgi:hypothetical protein
MVLHVEQRNLEMCSDEPSVQETELGRYDNRLGAVEITTFPKGGG